MKDITKWKRDIDKLDFAYQPIVNYETGDVLGYEALLRNTEKIGYDSIDHFFNKAYEKNILHIVEILLRKKAIEKFLEYKDPTQFKLFLNIDNRLINLKKIDKGKTKDFIDKLSIKNTFIVFEVSEKHKIDSYGNLNLLFKHYTKQNYQVAVDDYGTGFSSMSILYHTNPDYIKVDRFFIQNIHKDFKKQIFVKKLIETAHLVGHEVIAEGVETKEEFLNCQELGFDYVQGFYIDKPNKKLQLLPSSYPNWDKTKSKRDEGENLDLTLNMEIYPKVNYRAKFKDIFCLFKKDENYDFLVIVDDNDKPLGVLEDKALKEYIYSPYGSEILSKKRIDDKLDKLLTDTLIVNTKESIENILSMFSLCKNFNSIILVDNDKYKGVLSSKKLLDIIHKKQLLEASDQNPLTKLRGNKSINKYVQNSLNNKDAYIYIYFDLDNFKPYNDKYGFRNGDRIILLFADILKFFSSGKRYFIGHIGGDDFFMSASVKDIPFDEILETIKKIIDKFSKDVLSFYNKEDVEKGYILSKDRDGNEKKFKMLTVSAAILEVTPKSKKYKNEYADILAELKKSAKKSENHYSIATLL